MRRIIPLAALVVSAACHSAPPRAPVTPPPVPDAPALPNETTPEVLHARAVAILSLFSGGSIPAGDIFVTWTPKPDMYTTVSRTDSTVASRLVSTDGLVGTAQAAWQGDRQREVSIRWTKGAATLMEVNVRFEAGVIHVADGALVRLTRDRKPGFERRPLETTSREADYVRLRQSWEP